MKTQCRANFQPQRANFTASAAANDSKGGWLGLNERDCPFKDSTSIWRAFQITYLAFTIAATALSVRRKSAALLFVVSYGGAAPASSHWQPSDILTVWQTYIVNNTQTFMPSLKCSSEPNVSVSAPQIKTKPICISTFRAVQRGKRINLILLTDLL